MSYSRFLEDTPLIPGMMRLLDHTDLCQPARLADWIHRRLNEGLTVFDHADIYGDGECERVFGEALMASPELRQKVQVISKAGIVPAHRDSSPWTIKHYRAEADYFSEAIDKSLSRLRVDQIHTFLIHRPDPLLDAESLANALEQAVSAGVGEQAPERDDRGRLARSARSARDRHRVFHVSIDSSPSLTDIFDPQIIKNELQLLDNRN